MHRAELVAQKTHAAELAFLRVHAVAFDRNKNAHRTEINALVFRVAAMGAVAQVRIDIHLCPYGCCRPDFHNQVPLLVLPGPAGDGPRNCQNYSI